MSRATHRQPSGQNAARRFFVAAAALGLAALSLPGLPAQGAGNNQQPIAGAFSYTASGTTANGPSPILALTGAEQTCSIVVVANGSGATITAQQSADYYLTVLSGLPPSFATWVTATGFPSSGAISPSLGTVYTGNLAGVSVPTAFRIVVSGNSAALNGSIVCGTALGLGSSSGGTITAQPAPTSSPGATVNGFAPLLTGVNGTYPATVPDGYAVTSNIVSATTTAIVTNSGSAVIYLWYAGFQSTGTNSTNNVNIEWGTGATCGTGTQGLLAIAAAAGTSIGSIVGLYSGATQAAVNTLGIVPAAIPIPLPAGYNLCGVTVGTTTAGRFIALYSEK